MTDDELKALVASLAIAQQELTKKMAQTDEQIKHTDEQMRETDKKLQLVSAKLDKVAELVGNIGRNQGDVAEEFFFNSLANDTRLGDIHFDDISKNETKRRGNTLEEYDIVMTNGETVGIVEVKYKAHEKDLVKLERKVRNFKKLFPVYAHYKIYAAIASFHINEEAKATALERGFFVLQRTGKVIHTDCSPNLWVL